MKQQLIFLIALLVSIVFFFVAMSRLDYEMNQLYNYGLVFSYEWAMPYWSTYSFVLYFFGFTVSTAYFVGSKKTKQDAKISIALFASVFLLAFCGFQDVLFFVLWSGGLPPLSQNWWWMTALVATFGSWNSLGQIILLGACFTALFFIWLWALSRKRLLLQPNDK